MLAGFLREFGSRSRAHASRILRTRLTAFTAPFTVPPRCLPTVRAQRPPVWHLPVAPPLRFLLSATARRGLSSSSARDPYAVLGVPKSATAQELKKAYFAMAKKFHPDVNPSPQAAARFRELSEAYDLLRDPPRRAEYDRGGGSSWAGRGYQQQQQDAGPRQRSQQQQTYGSGSFHRHPYADMFADVWRELGVHDIEVGSTRGPVLCGVQSDGRVNRTASCIRSFSEPHPACPPLFLSARRTT